MRELLSRTLFSPLQGMTFRRWWALLRENRFRIAPRYWPRAGFQTAVSLMNSVVAAHEDRRFGPAIDAIRVRPPLFILGHWRSGTTHLHNLLALDPQFTFPTLYQTLYPGTFLSTEALVPRLGALLLLRTRPHDNIALDFGVPNEDELATLNDSGISSYLSWAFPTRAGDYDRYLTFAGVPGDEVDRWKRALVRFLRKLTFKNDRAVVLKSPPHTARIGLLLELFPDARFVHIHRDPIAVFQSTRHMIATTMQYWELQRRPEPEGDDRIIGIYRAMYDAYFAQRSAIPPGRACEIAYEALEHDPLSQVALVYESLGLRGFESVRPRMEQYLASIAGYRKNAHVPVSEALRERLAGEWGPSFQAWGYEASAASSCRPSS